MASRMAIRALTKVRVVIVVWVGLIRGLEM